MKLHLPNTLRKALLTCLAAVPALFTSTLASGALAAGALCSFALADDVALIADDEDDDDENAWTWAQPGGIEWGEIGDAINSGTVTLDPSTPHAAYKVKGANGGKYTFTGSATSLLVDHSGGAGNPVYLTFRDCNVENLWLTTVGGDVSTSNQNNYHFNFDNGNNAVDALSSLRNMYINLTGVQFISSAAQALSLNTNFILGGPGTKTNLNNNTVLMFTSLDVTTTGYLEASEDTKLTLTNQNSKLSVSLVKGNGNMEISTATASAAGATLTIREGGSYDGRLTFSGSQKLAFVLGDATHDAVQQSVGGLSGTVGASIQAATDKTATLLVTGSDAAANVISGIEVGRGVTLKVADAAAQTLNNVVGQANSAIEVASGGTLTLGGVSSVYNLNVVGELAVASGMDLTLTGVMDASAASAQISGSGGFLTMAYAEDAAPKLKLNAATAAAFGAGSPFDYISLGNLANGLNWQLLDLSAIDSAARSAVSEKFETLVSAILAKSNWEWKMDETTGLVTLTVIEYHDLDTDLLWNNASTNDNSWDNSDIDSWLSADGSGSKSAFLNGRQQNVTFDGEGASISVANGVSVGDMTVTNGDWEFTMQGAFSIGSLTIADGSSVVLNVSDTFAVPTTVTLNTGSSLTLAATELSGTDSAGLRIASAINVPTGASLVFKGWQFETDMKRHRGAGAITGDGFLVLDSCNEVGMRAVQIDVLAGQTGFAGTLVVTNGTVLVHGYPSYTQALNGNYFLNVVVKDGAWMRMEASNGALYNVTAGKDQTLTLSGTGGKMADGVTDTGVIYLTAGQDIAWPVALAGDVTININAANQTLGLSGKLDASSLDETGKGYTLTKIGTGKLELKTTFGAKDNTHGAFDVQEGTLAFTFTDTAALAAFTVNLEEDGVLNIAAQSDGSSYQVTTLSGSGTVSGPANGTGLLSIGNTHTAATAATFTGSVEATAEVQVSSGSYWKLGNGAAVAGALSVAGTVEFVGGSEGSGSLSTLKGDGSLTVSSGELTLTTADAYTGSLSVAAGATLVLDGEGTTSMSGTGSSLLGTVNVGEDATLSLSSLGTTAGGQVNLVAGSTLNLNSGAHDGLSVSMQGGGTISNAAAFTGSISVDDTGAANATFDVGGAGCTYTLVLHSGSKVQNVGSSITLTGASTVYLTLGGNATADTAFLLSDGSTVEFKTDANFERFEIDATSLLDGVSKDMTEGITCFIFNTKVEGWMDALSLNAASLIYLSVTDNEDGSLTFMYKSAKDGDVFVSTEETDTEGNVVLDSYDSLDGYTGTIVNKETIVDLTAADLPAGDEDGLVMRNLVGTESGSLDIVGKNDGTSRSVVTLQNTCTDDELREYADQNGLGGLTVDNAFGIASDVNVDSADLQIKHAALDTHLINSRTVMTGDLHIQNGDLLMTSGELELRGGADVEAVKFAGDNGQLIVNATVASVSSLSRHDAGTATTDGTAHNEHVLIENEGELVLKDGAKVGAGLVIGNEGSAYAGTVTVGDGSVISTQARLAGVVLNLQGDLSIEENVVPFSLIRPMNVPTGDEWMLAGITGSGALKGEMDMDITVQGADRTYSGDLTAYNGTMYFNASPYEQIFDGVVGSEKWNVVNKDGGHVTFDLMGKGANILDMGNLTLEKGSYTTILLDLADTGNRGMFVNTVNIDSGADVTIGHYQGIVTIEGADGEEVPLLVITPSDTANSTVDDGVNWHLKGVRNAGAVYVDPQDGVTLKMNIDNSNKYAKIADNVNSLTGANMIWTLGETQSYGGDLAAMDETLLDLVYENTAAGRAQANRIMAAAAGASIAAVSQAVSADVERQLRAIRNRTSGMVYAPAVELPAPVTVTPDDKCGGKFTTVAPAPPAKKSQSHMSFWLNGESNYYKQRADGWLPGVRTTGWGGTVGMSLTQEEHLSLGLALTAMYNDITTIGPDQVKGDMDTLYLSGFAQLAYGAWRHTFICSIGNVDVDANRTVNYGTGSYRTKMDTNGMAFGAMYEAGYSITLNDAGTMALQPVFNVAWRYSQLDGYREKGTTAALKVDDQEYNSVSLGLGARMQAVVGENAINQASILELRALVKTELGDRRGEANVALLSVERPAGKVYGAQRNVVGVELGAGLTVPLTTQSELFADFNADLRGGETNLNATLGFKINF